MRKVIVNVLKIRSNRMFLLSLIWALIAAFLTINIDPVFKTLFLASFVYSLKGFFFYFIENRTKAGRASTRKY